MPLVEHGITECSINVHISIHITRISSPDLERFRQNFLTSFSTQETRTKRLSRVFWPIHLTILIEHNTQTWRTNGRTDTLWQHIRRYA